MAKKKDEISETGVIGNELLPGETTESVAKAHEENKALPVDDNEEVETLVSGADFFEFTDSNNVFVGRYLGTKAVREKDGQGENQKAGSVMGYNFVSDDGEQYIIGNSHAVQKAMDIVESRALVKPRMRFTFLGQTKNSAGQKVNQFNIELLKK